VTRPAVGPGDSAARSKENVVVRNKFGTSTSDFKCRYDLLETLDEDMDAPQLKVTTERQCLERKHEISAAMAEAWKYRAAAARLKFARLNSKDKASRARVAAQIEVARCDLKVKAIEQKISALKQSEALRKVASVEKIEKEQLEMLKNLPETLAAVKNNKAIMADPKREKYFFSYCKQEGHAPWYCAVLDKRENWFEYPSNKWFITQKGTQLHCPMRNRMMDYSDQHVYSYACADIKGNECITDKGLLGQLKLPFTPQTFHIRECKWVGEVPPMYPPGNQDPEKAVWFVKDTLRNYSTGIYMCRSRDECLKISEKQNAYVVQPQITPLLVDGRKHHIRTYFLMFSPRGSTKTRFFVFREGYLACALKPWKFDDLTRDVQITRDRTCRVSEWDTYNDILPSIIDTLCQLSGAITTKLRPAVDKTNFMIVGLDLMVDPQMQIWLLEANAGPVVRGADFPTIKAMIDLAIPQGCGCDPEKDIVNKLWFEVFPMPDRAERAAFSKTCGAAISQALADAKKEAGYSKIDVGELKVNAAEPAPKTGNVQCAGNDLSSTNLSEAAEAAKG